MKKKYGWLIFILFILILTSCKKVTTEEILAGKTTKPELLGVKDEGVLRVGNEVGYPPFNWMEKDESKGGTQVSEDIISANGYDVKIAQKIAEGLGLKLEVVKVVWEGLGPSLNSGKIDLIVAGMSPTKEREMTMDFSESYYTSKLAIVLRKDSPYSSAKTSKEFIGAKLTGQISTLHYDVIDNIEGAIKEPAMDDFSAMRIAVQAKKIDGYVTELPEAIGAIAVNSELEYIVPEDGFGVSDDELSVAIGMRKQSVLKDKINEILNTISEEERNEMMVEAIKNQPILFGH